MIKLIAADIDGTLLPAGSRSPSPFLIETLTRALDAGVRVALASGRPLCGLNRLFPTLSDRLDYICSNGAHLAHGAGTFSVTPLAEGDALKHLTETVRALGCDFMVDTTEDTLVERSISPRAFQAISDSSIRVKLVDDILAVPLPILKFSLAAPGNPNSFLRLPQIAALAADYTLVTTGSVFFDIIAKGIDKGTGVRALQEQYGITPEQTAVFGDAMNDVSMFFGAAHSFAVENAPEEVRRHAIGTFLPPEQDGVARKLRDLL